MSYRLVDSNELAIRYPEVNDMPCIYADLTNGLDNEYYDLSSRHKGHWIRNHIDKRLHQCSECNGIVVDMPKSYIGELLYKGCPYCMAEMER